MTDTPPNNLVIEYNVTDGAIAELGEAYKDADATTPDGYKNVVQGIAKTRTLRVEVESTRKVLKKDALAFGRAVDKEARRITASLWEVEDPLKKKKDAVDAETARKRAEIEEARREEARKKIEAERKVKDEEERKKREAEEARLAEERAVEEGRLAYERRKLEKEKAELEAMRQAELKRLNEENDKLEAKRRAEARQRRDEEAARAKRQAAEDKTRQEEEQRIEKRRAELQRLEDERKAREKAELEVEQRKNAEASNRAFLAEMEEKRVAALPDVEKLGEYVGRLEAVVEPEISSPSGNAVFAQIDKKIYDCRELVKAFALELSPPEASYTCECCGKTFQSPVPVDRCSKCLLEEPA